MRVIIRRATTRLLAAAAVATLLLPGTAGIAAATGSPTDPVGGPALAGRGLVVDAPGATPLPDVGAASWVLADLDSGEVLAAQDAHGRYRPASTLKILTALTLLPQLDPEASYTARFEDANVDGSKVGIVPEATYTVHNLFEALFLVSGNDAARSLATAAGGVGPTTAAMSTVARDLGARDTKVVNPSGLDAKGQYTSAYDLAVIGRAAMAREDFRTYVGTVKSQFPGKMPKAGKVRKTFEIYTQDRLLLNYRGAIGIKTGWTTKARGTFVGAATRGGRTLVATVMRTDGQSWRESGDLLTWGFKNASLARPVGTLNAVTAPYAAVDSGGSSAQSNGQDPAATTVSTAGSGTSLPWWLQVPLALLVVVAVLRTRVLVRDRVRRSGWPRRGLPQPRGGRGDFRAVLRDASAPTAAPTPAPTSTVRLRPRRSEDDSTNATSSDGAAS